MSDFEQIRPLVQDYQIDDGRLWVRFVCPVTGFSVDANSNIYRQGGSRPDQLRRSFSSSARNVLSSTFQNMLGSSRSGPSRAAQGYREVDVQRSIQRAFHSVKHMFVPDRQRNCWVAAQRPAQGFAQQHPQQPQQATGFAQAMAHRQPAYQQQAQPPQGPPGLGGQAEFDAVVARSFPRGGHDRELLARILIDLARVDGQLDLDECQYLTRLFPQTNLNQLAQYPMLTPRELREASPEARPALLLLAYAMAFANGSLSYDEKAMLSVLERGLGMEARHVEWLRAVAQGAIIERVLDGVYADGYKTAEEGIELEKVARDLGLSRQKLEQMDRAYRQRRGGW